MTRSTHEAAMRTGAHRVFTAWRAAFARFATQWTRWCSERDRDAIDRWHRVRRDAHERFLAGARDPYELERLEREWERRHHEMWRVF